MNHHDLFADTEHAEPLLLEGGAELRYFAAWYRQVEADAIYRQLLNDVSWSQPVVKVYGKHHVIPRRQAWYGDAGSVMRYSGKSFYPQPWLPLISDIKSRLESAVAASFNSCLVNHYRDGGDCVGWHADDEVELGPDPVIASLSFGATRHFRLRPKSGSPAAETGRVVQLPLHHGDLLLMNGATQRHWQHAVLREKRVEEPRINLTFRLIVHQS